MSATDATGVTTTCERLAPSEFSSSDVTMRSCSTPDRVHDERRRLTLALMKHIPSKLVCLVLGVTVLALSTGCRGMQINQLEKRVASLETRVAVLESQVAHPAK
jgi:hypothetical protein